MFSHWHRSILARCWAPGLEMSFCTSKTGRESAVETFHIRIVYLDVSHPVEEHERKETSLTEVMIRISIAPVDSIETSPGTSYKNWVLPLLPQQISSWIFALPSSDSLRRHESHELAFRMPIQRTSGTRPTSWVCGSCTVSPDHLLLWYYLGTHLNSSSKKSIAAAAVLPMMSLTTLFLFSFLFFLASDRQKKKKKKDGLFPTYF